MSNKVKLISGIAALVVLLSGAYYAYNLLTKNYEKNNDTNNETNIISDTNTPIETVNPQESVAPSETNTPDEVITPKNTNTPSVASTPNATITPNPNKTNAPILSEAPNKTEVPNKAAGDAPDFTVIDSKGNKVKLSDFRGKPVVLNFWASWCPPCKSEMPHFNKVYQNVKDEVQFLMVDLVDGKRETQKKGADYIASQGYVFPIYFDTTSSAANAYNISSIPSTFFISKDGNIVSAHEGMISENKLLTQINLIK